MKGLNIRWEKVSLKLTDSAVTNVFKLIKSFLGQTDLCLVFFRPSFACTSVSQVKFARYTIQTLTAVV
jgi:hypothetical protein